MNFYKKTLVFIIGFFGVFLYAQEISVSDYFGTETFKEPIKKIIYLGSYAEVPAMFNIWDRVVGMASYGFESDIVKATANNLSNIKKLSDDHYAALNVESLKLLSPDVVITYVGNPQSIEFAKKFGIKFLSFQTKTIQGVIDDIKSQEKILLPSNGDKKIAKMEEILTFIEDKTKNIKNKKRVVEIFHKPNQISGKESLDSDILKNAGVENLGLKLISHGRAEVSLEKIVSENPDIIFIWWLSPYNPKDILNNPQFQTIKAIKNKQVYKLPPMDIAGPRTPLIALYVAYKSYPELFSPKEIKNILINYYKIVFDLHEDKIKPFLWE